MAPVKGWVVGLLLVLLSPSQLPLSGVVSGQEVAEEDLHGRIVEDVVAEEGETADDADAAGGEDEQVAEEEDADGADESAD